MNGTASSYDYELQMYREPEHSLDLDVLTFWKWLKEHDRIEIFLNDNDDQQP